MASVEACTAPDDPAGLVVVELRRDHAKRAKVADLNLSPPQIANARLAENSAMDVAQVKAAIADKALEIGWNDVPRPAPLSETIYRVLQSG